MNRKVIPLRAPAVDPAELADWDSKTEYLRAGIADGTIAGIISLVIHADGSVAVIPRGHLFRDQSHLSDALQAMGEAWVHKP